MNAPPAFDRAPAPVGQAYTLHPAAEPCAPVVFATPHSGRLYPAEMMDASHLDAASIRRSEDALVDRLLAPAPASGLAVVGAVYARAFVDVNREPYELDPAMYEDELPAFAQSRTARVAAGLGAIARVVAEGQEIYTRKLTFAEARSRIEAVHRPYHMALTDEIERLRARAGLCVLVDWHSMPSAAGRSAARGGRAADFVLGDRFGAACAPAITRLVEQTLERLGYLTVRNAPYAGGYTTEFYGRPGRGVHALQIEINRALYLDEATLEPNAGFDALAAKLQQLFAVMAEADWPRLI